MTAQNEQELSESIARLRGSVSEKPNAKDMQAGFEITMSAIRLDPTTIIRASQSFVQVLAMFVEAGGVVTFTDPA